MVVIYRQSISTLLVNGRHPLGKRITPNEVSKRWVVNQQFDEAQRNRLKGKRVQLNMFCTFLMVTVTAAQNILIKGKTTVHTNCD